MTMVCRSRFGICQAQVVAATEFGGNKITTIVARYPRFIHAELMTHRVFSRNARSSRAVPVKRMLDEIKNNPVVPIYWGKNQKGMQAGEEINTKVALKVGDFNVEVPREDAWLYACKNAMEVAEAFSEAGYHKQIVNRLLEPFMFIDTLITSVEWDNFFNLRIHPDAEPHINDLARAIKSEIDNATYARADRHLPYASSASIEEHSMTFEDRVFVSAARCARISYRPFQEAGGVSLGGTEFGTGEVDVEGDLRRGKELLANGHMSPFDHIARYGTYGVNHSRNFFGTGWESGRSVVGK